MYFIDSNTCIYFMNGKFPSVREKFLSVSPKEIKISSVVKGELLLGAFKSHTREKTTEKVEKFLKPFEMIAATVLHEKGTLITHNANEFSRVNGLKIEDWVV